MNGWAIGAALKRWVRWLGAGTLGVLGVDAAPRITRLTPPSALFAFGDPAPPYIARFVGGQRFDLQATVQPDAGQTIMRVEFLVDGESVGTAALAPANVPGLGAGSVVASRRAFSSHATGARRLRVVATQADGQVAAAEGNFEIVALSALPGDVRARNVVVMVGDGFGIAHRTAARIMLHGISQGKALAPLAMDALPVNALVRTASLNSIVTDSAPGASCYATGNKADNNEEGVFPDDTLDPFDNPRVENLGEFLARTQGKWLGIVTTADVTDATPGAFGVHTANRSAGTGIADQFFDETVPQANLRVLLGGGRASFLPASTPGSNRVARSDYQLTEELAAGWQVKRGQVDPERDLLAEFQAAGFTYVSDRERLAAIPAETRRLLGLFHFGHLNAALDRMEHRRGHSRVVEEYGFPRQPLLEEMVGAALQVLQQAPNGFVLLIEAGGIDKQAHAMDTERWLLEAIEFDRAVARVSRWVESSPDTLMIVTADHETGGANVIGGSVLPSAAHQREAGAGGGTARLRDQLVGTYGAAGFPQYLIADDGFPERTEVERRLLVGYAANADRHEDWLTNAKPLGAPGGPSNPVERDRAGGYFVTGQVPGSSAVHTGSDVPLSAGGAGAGGFGGVMDNTDVFFGMMRALTVGAPAGGRASVSPPTEGGSTGATSAELVRGQRTAADRLVNLATRGYVGTGDAILIGGFVVAGTHPHQVLVRALGPALVASRVTGALADPALQVVDHAGRVVATNDNWGDGGTEIIQRANAAAGAPQLPAGSTDAALVATLAPGAYTVLVRGVGAATGIALLEVFELP